MNTPEKAYPLYRRFLSAIGCCAFMAVLPAAQAQLVVLDENFDRATLGGQLIPGSPVTNTTNLKTLQSHDPAIPGHGPSWNVNDQGVIVQDLREGSSGRALKFYDRLSGSTSLRVNYGLSIPQEIDAGFIRFAWDFQMDALTADWSNGQAPLSVRIRQQNTDTQAFGDILSFDLRPQEGGSSLRIYSTDSSTGVTTAPVFGSTNDLLANTLYRFELDVEIETGLYHISVYNEIGTRLLHTQDGLAYWNRFGEEADFFHTSAINFYGGSSNFLTDTLRAAESNTGPVIDNLRVTYYAIPEPHSIVLISLAGILLLFRCRRGFSPN